MKLTLTNCLAAVTYVVDSRSVAVCMVQPERRILHGHAVPEQCECVLIMALKEKIHAPVPFSDEDEFLSVGSYFCLPKKNLFRNVIRDGLFTLESYL